MSLKLMNADLLSRCTSNVVKRADYEQVLQAREVLVSVQEAAAQQRRQLETLRQEATRAGYAAGLEMGKQAWAQQLVEQQASRHVQFKGMRQVLVDAVMSSVRHLLGELPENERFEKLAEHALQSVVRARQLRLVVAAVDAPVAYSVLERWRRQHPDVAVDVVVDSALTAGDCLLETDEGAIDGRLNQRLAAIEAALQRHLHAVSPMANHPNAAASVTHGGGHA